MTRHGFPLARVAALVLPSLLVAGPVQAAPSEQDRERAEVARAIDSSIGWFARKDFDLSFRVHSSGPDLFLFQPRSTDTIRSGEQFRKFSEVFRDPGFTYLRHEVKDLRVNLARKEKVAWFSALLDDCATIEGKEGCWKDARWTGVLEKRKGQWVIVQAHFSFAAPPERSAIPEAEARALSAKARNSLTPSGAYPEIERVIRAGIAWAETKDTALLYGTRAQDENLLVFPPHAKSPVVGFEAFRKRGEALWLRPDFEATGYDINDVRIHLSPRGTVAWFSAVLDDWCEIAGRADGWKGVRWTGVLEKRQGRWLYVQGHFSFATDQLAPPKPAPEP